ncbi:MAG TPA: T9SS type A sorting domain-containing protein, partial [Chitinophagaceae bacterium]|nr:T9SS type A sorting domain-containing protein [Chitinophagaceae bacterium]
QFSVVFQQTNTPPFYTNLYEQRFDNNGDAVWTEAVQISTLTTASYRYYDVRADKDTTYIGYYGNPSGKNRFDAYVQKVLHDGSLPWGANGSAFSDYSKDTDPSEQTINISERSNDGYVYAVCTFTNPTQTESGIYFQKINANTGERALGNNAKQLFDITTELRAITGSGIRFSPGFSPVSIGFTFIDANNLLFASALTPDGNFKWLNLYSVLSSTSNSKLRHAFSYAFNGILEEGSPFIAIWQENKGDGDKPYTQDVNSISGTLGTLPARLANFKAIKTGSTIQLQWQTPTEINNKGFYIQRSFDGIHFSNIGFAASKAVDGNSTLTLNYTFTDNKPGNKNYYRLQQTDKDGKISFSSIVQMNMTSSEKVQLFPNPVKDKLSISISSSQQNFTVIVTDAKGMQVAKKNSTIINGATELDVHALTPGIYFVKIIDAKNAKVIATERFIKD